MILLACFYWFDGYRGRGGAVESSGKGRRLRIQFREVPVRGSDIRPWAFATKRFLYKRLCVQLELISVLSFCVPTLPLRVPS